MRNTRQTADDLLAPGRGILVADEYVDRTIARMRPRGAARETCSSSDYLGVALDSAGLEGYLAGVLLTPKGFRATEQLRTLKQYREGTAPLVFGVQMDATRARARNDGLPGGLEDVRRDLADYRLAGARFAEWRANVDPTTVPRGQVHVDSAALAQGAAASQAEGVLPMVTVAMPDLASHSIAVTQAATVNALRRLFTDLDRLDVDLDALVLRINMALPGDGHRHQPSPDQVAGATLRMVDETVPPGLAGIGFLSGGQDTARAVANLAAIADLARSRTVRPRLTFAFTRALVRDSVRSWACDPENAPQAQRDLVQSCRLAGQALSGSLDRAVPA